jgi:hypothetical protein
MRWAAFVAGSVVMLLGSAVDKGLWTKGFAAAAAAAATAGLLL